MSSTTNNNININNKSNDKENIAEAKVRRSGRTPKPSEKVRERTIGSPNGNKYGIRRVIRERRQPQYERVIRNRRINLDVPLDTSLYQLSREWVADNPHQFPDHVVATPLDSTVVSTCSRTLASIVQNPQLPPSETDPKFSAAGLPIKPRRTNEDFDKIIRHEPVSQTNADSTKPIIAEEDDDLLMHHLEHFKKVKAWWQSTMETRLVPAKQQIDPILASSVNSDEGS